ncbi:MAG: tRNA1(Val) (adenine(37)-N6)-methyltransferase [Firmicutes bacterium]|nr:tRNA1(Val) (adenine(37)-N6)-methyltransferase [Bacillota bacterium]
MDSVLLSNFAKVKKGGKMLDLCSGNGVIPILMSAKNKAESYKGIEYQKQSVDMAERSIKLNGIEEKVSVVKGDILCIKDIEERGTYDTVTCNPPYMLSGQGSENENESLYIARHEVKCTLKDVFEAASYALKYGGKFYMVHRPERLCDIMYFSRKYDMEVKKIRFVLPRENATPSLVLSEHIKGGKPSLDILPSFIVYDKNNNYTESFKNMYYGHL